MFGTRAPTGKNFVATAMPNWPDSLSWAMIDQVILSAACGVSLIAARVGGGATPRTDLRCRGEAAFGPVAAALDDVTARGQGVGRSLRQPALGDEDAGPRGARPERNREMFGVPGRRVDRFLQVHPGMDVAQEELGRPLVLLVTAWCAPGEIRLAVAQREGGAQRGARTFARRERGRMAFLE